MWPTESVTTDPQNADGTETQVEEAKSAEAMSVVHVQIAMPEAMTDVQVTVAEKHVAEEAVVVNSDVHQQNVRQSQKQDQKKTKTRPLCVSRRAWMKTERADLSTVARRRIRDAQRRTHTLLLPSSRRLLPRVVAVAAVLRDTQDDARTGGQSPYRMAEVGVAEERDCVACGTGGDGVLDDVRMPDVGMVVLDSRSLEQYMPGRMCCCPVLMVPTMWEPMPSVSSPTDPLPRHARPYTSIRPDSIPAAHHHVRVLMTQPYDPSPADSLVNHRCRGSYVAQQELVALPEHAVAEAVAAVEAHNAARVEKDANMHKLAGPVVLALGEAEEEQERPVAVVAEAGLRMTEELMVAESATVPRPMA